MRAHLPLVVTLLAAGALIGGCGGGDEQPAGAPPAASTRLAVQVTGAHPDPLELTFACGGDKPCKDSQLAALAKVAEPPDPARACTEIYGGPEQAHVTGTLAGRAVDVTVARSDGCGIADYEALFKALGRKPPLAPAP
jgi:hypothetical protein